MSLFELGSVVATRAALAYCEKHQVNPLSLLGRHMGGDWGDIDEKDVVANAAAILHGLRVFSSYKVGNGKVWVITEADRSSTCLLLPEDY